jgi:hypothetical protein
MADILRAKGNDIGCLRWLFFSRYFNAPVKDCQRFVTLKFDALML